MKSWEECLEDKVSRRTVDRQQAKSLLRMARIRVEDNKDREVTDEKASLVVEAWWEAMKQLTTALLNLEGYKSYSQECLLSFLDEFHDFTRQELEKMDQIRRLRNDIDYRGEFLDTEYIDRNQEKAEELIHGLENMVEESLENDGVEEVK